MRALWLLPCLPDSSWLLGSVQRRRQWQQQHAWQPESGRAGPLEGMMASGMACAVCTEEGEAGKDRGHGEDTPSQDRARGGFGIGRGGS